MQPGAHHGLPASDPTGIGTVGQPKPSQTLTREERIRQRPDFLLIQQRGIRTRGRYMTIVGLPNVRSISRLGVVAPRRLGKAVRRNRAKRRVRELFRHNKPLVGLDLVVLPRREFLDAPFAVLLDDYQSTLRRQVRSRRSV
ncbi:MAG: ribonuclease P protein component [Chloroflexi bacterium]|nr:MAG: ribonuclease P protein component [Chloroflexota bacterium]